MNQPAGPSRRAFLAGASATVALAGGKAQAQTQVEKPALPAAGQFPVRAIASHNGLECVRTAYAQLMAGADTLDAAIAGVTLVEDDPNDTSVGYGGLPNEDGVVELDAAVMHGPTHRGGAVAALRNIKNPSHVARVVMNRSDHVLLVGEGALRFARAHGFREQELLTERARKIWLNWKETLSDRDDWIPPPREEWDPEVIEHLKRNPGTIHCGAMNAKGEISCCTTTSGLAFKLPGRVGDSPILGAGLYVDNQVGSCGSTGRGEANLQNLSSMAAVELMRGGQGPREAGLEVLRRVAATTPKRLLAPDGGPDFGLSLYLLSKDGRYAGVTMRAGEQFAVCDERGARLEDCVPLFEKLPRS